MKNNLKIVFFITAFASALPVTSWASDMTRNQNVSFIENTSIIGDIFGAADKGKTFTDNFGFEVGSNFDANSAVVSIATNKSSQVTLSALELSGNNGKYYGTFSASPAFNTFNLSAQNLDAGKYILTVLGTVNGTAGGSYGGNINVASAVPENSVNVLMAAGLMLVALAAVRRKKLLSSLTNHIGALEGAAVS